MFGFRFKVQRAQPKGQGGAHQLWRGRSDGDLWVRWAVLRKRWVRIIAVYTLQRAFVNLKPLPTSLNVRPIKMPQFMRMIASEIS